MRRMGQDKRITFFSEVGLVEATKKALLLPPRSSSIEIEPDQARYA